MVINVPEGRHPAIREISRYFDWAHLPPPLRKVSKACADLAQTMIDDPEVDGPELTTGLRKLLEAKDCFVRAALKPRERI